MSKKKQEEEVEVEKFVELRGVVLEAMPSATFIVSCDGHSVLARVNGKMRQSKIRVLPGDNVVVQVSPYDMSLGRISQRLL